MIDLESTASVSHRPNLNPCLDEPRRGSVLPISLQMPLSVQTLIEPSDMFFQDQAMPGVEYQGRERAKFLSRITGRLGDKLVPLRLQDVLWIQSNGNLLIFHLKDVGYNCRMTMKDLVVRLDPDCFFRIHKNAIVNLDHVVDFDLPRYGNAIAHLRNGKALPISKVGRIALRRSFLPRSY